MAFPHWSPTDAAGEEHERPAQRRHRRLEERVDELDRERRRAQCGIVTHPTERIASDQRYKEAVERLRAVDPDSPYLP
jgi:hypothetical protein